MTARGKLSGRDGHLRKGALWTIRAVAVLATALASYLMWISWGGDPVAGCGPASDCQQVLNSRWAYWFGIPVSALALAVYLAILMASLWLDPGMPAARQRLGWAILYPCSILLIAAAFWFVALQLVANRTLCPFCLAAQGCGLVLAATILMRAPFRPAPEKPWEKERQVYLTPRLTRKLFFAAWGGIVVLVIGQTAYRPATHVIKPIVAGPVTNAIAESAQANTIPAGPAVTNQTARRAFQIYNGRYQFDMAEVPVLGSPDAPHVGFTLFDYTCKGCRIMHAQLKEAVTVFTNQLAFVSIPMPLDIACNPLVPKTLPAHSNACEYARLGLAVWRGNRDKFQEFEDWVFKPLSPPPLDQTRQFAAGLVGEAVLNQALEDGWVNHQIQTGVSVFGMNYLTYSNSSLPQVIIGTNVTFGTFARMDDLYSLIEQHFGLVEDGTKQSASPVPGASSR